MMVEDMSSEVHLYRIPRAQPKLEENKGNDK
jgi:hypothetical protein